MELPKDTRSSTAMSDAFFVSEEPLILDAGISIDEARYYRNAFDYVYRWNSLMRSGSRPIGIIVRWRNNDRRQSAASGSI